MRRNLHSGEYAESYDLHNVHERLRLFSQEIGGGLTITSEQGIGTTATLKIKLDASSSR